MSGYYVHDNANLIWLTLAHHKVILNGVLGLEWRVDRESRLVVNDITEEQYTIPENLNVS